MGTKANHKCILIRQSTEVLVTIKVWYTLKVCKKASGSVVLGAIAKRCLGINAIGMAWLFTDSVPLSNL